MFVGVVTFRYQHHLNTKAVSLLSLKLKLNTEQQERITKYKINKPLKRITILPLQYIYK